MSILQNEIDVGLVLSQRRQSEIRLGGILHDLDLEDPIPSLHKSMLDVWSLLLLLIGHFFFADIIKFSFLFKKYFVFT